MHHADSRVQRCPISAQRENEATMIVLFAPSFIALILMGSIEIYSAMRGGKSNS
jgi:hypothetical protein